ncbi:phage tail tube protein [Ancylobacter lacus]|uniref:phage tail tube protein n=1 Tax=Ancylobacter lacus TaxID=2579970 RepID=UPI001BCE102C|nr:phage tail tube protein [Ancylobacter lacus]MBS7541497.1 hypothetical protein [Ancylobacter lacus]
MALTAKRLRRKMAIAAKVETDYGVDAVPTGGANAIQVSDPTLTPLAGDEVRRDLILPYLGNQGALLVGDYAELQFSVEIAGAGTPGTAPAYGPLLRACSWAEVILAGTSVTYRLASDNPESATVYVNIDGVRHALLGGRGTFTMSLTPKQIPRFTFTLRGLFGPVTDTALPAEVLTGFIRPAPVSKANTPVFSLHGYSAIAESLSIDLGNTVEARHLIGEESIVITDRRATGTAVIEAKSIATKNWFGIAQAGTPGALAVQHGTVAGNIVEIAAPKVQLGRPTYGETQGITNYSLPLLLTPDTGDDELSIVVR